MENTIIPESLEKKFILIDENTEFAVFPILMTPFTRYIVHKIGTENYIFTSEDIIFLNRVDSYWNKQKDKESCMKAVEDYLEKKIDEDLIDPYELVIDAFS